MTNPRAPIVLVTDFGYTDTFAGIMKGVIAGIAPRAIVIDLTHGIRPRDVFQAAFVLYRSVDYFPRGTIFCTVVDPGVGTARRPIAVKTSDFVFVGPDNGLIWPAANANGIEAMVCLDNPACFLPSVSTTFHGRDIFAPVAARLWSGTNVRDLGSVVEDLVRLDFPSPAIQGDSLVVTVMDVDQFGNLTLNISPEDFQAFSGPCFSLGFKGKNISRFHQTYGEAGASYPFVLPGSSGLMEIAVKNSSAAMELGAGILDRFLLSRPD